MSDENIKQLSTQGRTALSVLNALAFNHKRQKYPSVPIDCLPQPKYKDKKANDLTKCIIDFLNFSGWQAERISSTGRMVDRRQQYTDVLGRQRTIGAMEWIKGSGTKGTADISATIMGRAVKIEVKIGDDKQSSAQKVYQSKIESAGGIYLVAANFQDFFNWYNQTFKHE